MKSGKETVIFYLNDEFAIEKNKGSLKILESFMWLLTD